MEKKSVSALGKGVFLFVLTISMSSCSKENSKSLNFGSVSDKEGNIYKTIEIGNQTWMAEDLNSTMFSNGDPVANLVDNTEWSSSVSGAYCHIGGRYDGKFYNWYAISDPRNLCPTGWHIPDNTDWNTLFEFVGTSGTAAPKLKEVGIYNWNEWKNVNTNETGFSALPTGGRYNNGSYNGVGMGVAYWSKTEASSNESYTWKLVVNSTVFENQKRPKDYGFSVRCVKD